VLLKYSEAKRWKDARYEWRLNHIWYADIEDARTCECGHYPICEICVVENDVNGTFLEIGNCCVNQISPEFNALKRIFPALREGRINPAIVDYAFKQRIINDWEKRFFIRCLEEIQLFAQTGSQVQADTPEDIRKNPNLPETASGDL